MIALDTNLLVYSHRSRAPQHTRAQRAVERAASDPRGWGFAAAVLPEFWAVVTHPAAEGRPSSPSQAAAFIRALTTAGAAVWLPGPGFGERLLQLADDLSVSGPRVFDLQIALAAFEGGATEIWSHDAAFVAVPGLRVVDPLSQRAS
ncbi:MAG: TA system VapC family ribonuclease toxin [Vicinamibacterales bacterium]